MKKQFIYLIFLGLFLFSAYQSESQTLSKKIIWKKSIQYKVYENEYQKKLNFSDAIFIDEFKDLPVFYERIALPSRNFEVEANIQNAKYLPLAENEIVDVPSMLNIKDSIIIKTSITTARKQFFCEIFIIPLRKNISTGNYEKLISFDLNIAKNKIPEKEFMIQNYRENSVLSSGNWYKVKVSENGIYKITYSELVNMGIDAGSVDPRNIRIYGNGGGMLPEANHIEIDDDLIENAIFVHGEEDGKFNQSDYILFYGESAHVWDYNPFQGNFVHKTNIYSDYTYYFINTDIGVGKRLQTQQSSTLEHTNTVTKFTDHVFHDEESVNLISSGKEWYGEVFDLSTEREYSFDFPDIVTSEDISIRTSVAARSESPSFFKIYSDNELIQSITVNSIPSTINGAYAINSSSTTEFSASSSNINLKISYTKTTSASIGWLNFFELNVMRNLKFNQGQMPFRNSSCIGNGNISKFIVSNAGNIQDIWNVSNPSNITKINTTISGSNLEYKLPTDSLLEFIAFDGTFFNTIEFIEKIENQNLHGLSQIDYVIVSHPEFYNETQQLAAFHVENNGLSVFLTTPEKIYNEFSSGAQDISAIRNFMRMLYENAEPGDEPKYLLLFGDASYDYKNRIPGNTNFVPSWESVESLKPTYSYVTDDYFGLLDPDEGNSATGNLDIGIGRIPVFSREQSISAIEKIFHYTSNSDDVKGSWRNYITFVADDEEGNMHFNQAEELADLVEDNYFDYNIDKIYFDSYPQISTPGGQRYPGVNEAINKRIEKGTLIINYTGHGGELGWGHERVLENSDINNWNNYNKLAVFVTATCEFSRYDDPNRTAAGEWVFLNPNGGAISMFTTARATYSSGNLTLNKWFYKTAFNQQNGEYPRMGDIMMNAKIQAGSGLNERKFVLLGDPALTIAYPNDSVATHEINGHEVSISTDTLKALSKVNISGSIYDNAGNKMTNYNGLIFPTVFDKASEYSTYGQDPGSSPAIFHLRNKILYKGKAEIANGDFSYTFFVPKDIAYNFGSGRISYYARSEDSDANGYFEDFIVGGYNQNAEEDISGPQIHLYINNTDFKFGGITDENPVMFANVSDEHGINTIGNGIGHDIVAILDDNNDEPFVLNDYYEANIGDYTSGIITFPFYNLSEGKHTLYLKVWDVYNNSSEAYTEFVVNNSSEITIENLYNYPNPFIDYTNFVFEHNQPDSELDVQIQIFSISGQLVKTINTFVFTNGYRSEPINWNGLDNNGSKVKKGLYIYRLVVRNSLGINSVKRAKLVII
ncbi:MAG: type IX secretion system sortase PorU [Bacteroidales bacterium]|nr:type IX secretion system sortase PorU [Bacteroidales bacterium]